MGHDITGRLAEHLSTHDRNSLAGPLNGAAGLHFDVSCGDKLGGCSLGQLRSRGGVQISYFGLRNKGLPTTTLSLFR